jgi:hypothetical protein
VDSAAAETHVRLLAESQLRRGTASPRYLWLDEDFWAGGLPPEEEGLLRVSAVLSALSKVGTLSGTAASRLLGDFAAALAARGLCTPDALFSGLAPGDGPGRAGRAGSGQRPAAVSPATVAPGGSYRAIPLGVAVPAERDGYLGQVHLQTLVLAPGRAAIMTTFVSSWREAGGPAGTVPTGQSPSFPPFGGSGLTDDRDRPYQLRFETGDAGWHESGVLDLSPVPPPGTRWLDIPLGPGRPLRIELTGQAPAPVRAEPRTPRAPGELLLDAVADTMLGGGPMPGIEATQLASSLAEVAEALEAVGALPPDSPAAARLARLCQRRAIEVRGALADHGRSMDLPGSWASVLDHDRRQEGRLGVLPAAAVLPEIDGARFVLAGLVSGEREAIMSVFAWGWEPRPRAFRPGQPFSWWARDNAGRWHVGRWPPYDTVAGTFHLEFYPPLDPAATSLDIILTGRSSQLTATLPLARRRRLAEPEDQDISC